MVAVLDAHRVNPHLKTDPLAFERSNPTAAPYLSSPIGGRNCDIRGEKSLRAAQLLWLTGTMSEVGSGSACDVPIGGETQATARLIRKPTFI
jgi:hypothetical protein